MCIRPSWKPVVNNCRSQRIEIKFHITLHYINIVSIIIFIIPCEVSTSLNFYRAKVDVQYSIFRKYRTLEPT